MSNQGNSIDFDQRLTDFQQAALDFMRSGQALAMQAVQQASPPFTAPVAPNIAGGALPISSWLTGLGPIDDKTGLAINALTQEHNQELAQLWQQTLSGNLQERIKPEPGDRRFSAPEWRESALSFYTYQSYLLNSRYLKKLADLLPAADEKSKRRFQFLARQTVESSAPSNFPVLNPQFIKQAIATEGKSINEGIKNMIADLGKGRISMTDESAFTVGQNVATTEGGVVFENEVFQLIQYTALTEKVAKRPLLIVPPCINKYYIMDLQPENSLVRHAIESGQTVFLMSWRNPQAEQGHYTWDDYLEQGPLTAIKVVQAISGEDEINALGFCVGGTILSSALAVLNERGSQPVQCLTLMTTLLDFSESGEIGLFIDEAMVKQRESTFGKGGLLKGQELAGTFSALRGNDLIWNYVVSNYLLGNQPPAFDLLYWNSDSTNMPGPLAAWYMRHMYLQNELRIPNRLRMCGVKVDLSRLTMPAYVMAAREDHIVPWQSAYLTTEILGGEIRFVLGASGHIAGAINSAKKNRRSYWVNPETAPTAEAWLAAAEERPGSWWNDWSAWLTTQSGGQVKARKLGNRQYKVIEPAPGRYVQQKAA